MKKLLLAGAVVATMLLSGCSIDKTTQPFQDAPRSDVKNNAPADIVTMPDGFSNLATKCDHGNRIYVIFKADDSTRGSVSVVASDPTC